MVQEPWVDLLEDARLAPSPHNTQPWLLRVVSADRAELRYDPARLLPVTNPTGRFMVCGLGIFVEALSIAAAACGFELGWEYDGARLDNASARSTTTSSRAKPASS